jgi:isocitrate dehydrogenase
VTPFVVTKKTVFKWQEEMWQKMRDVFNKDYKDKFNAAGTIEKTGLT